MNERIKFEVYKALTYLKKADKFNNSLTKLAGRLNNETDKSADWWQGGSYDAYKEVSTNIKSGTPFVLRITDSSMLLRRNIVRAATCKRKWETDGKKCF